jgi:glycosyltransferase involved in cell wall biosynthesis
MNMSKVAYDYQIFCWQTYGGISRYFYELITRIAASGELNVQVLAGAYMNKYLQQSQPGLVWGFSVPRISKLQKILGIINTETSKAIFKSNPPDIVHETFYQSERLASKKSKVVITIHDMSPEKFPQFFAKYGMAEVKKLCVERADHIICVSENTKRDLIEILNVDPAKISVIYHASSLSADVENLESDANLSDPYILYVGGRGGHKNFDRLLKAYAISKQLKNHFKLVCFGGDPLSQREISLAQELGLSEGTLTRIIGDDSTLASLYKSAVAFVYPSLYEGFGIPLLEAMSLHCPVICSNTSSLPEVAGDAAEYFDPYDLESMANSLEKMVFSSDLRNDLVKRGIERVKQFSWDTCAKKTQEVYLTLL